MIPSNNNSSSGSKCALGIAKFLDLSKIEASTDLALSIISVSLV